MPELKRSSSLYMRDEVYLGKGPAVIIRGYDTSGKFVCRLAVSNAGVAVYSGGRGQKFLGDLTWEQLADKLSE
jgi:hypothetical protein